eukprot:s3260_g8.t1
MAGHQESRQPWRCVYCKRLNKMVATHCGSCETVWSRCIDINYVHGRKKDTERSYADWEESYWDTSHQEQERSSSRRRNATPRGTPRGRKDSPRQKQQPKGKGKKDAKPSPFQPLGGKPPASPWPPSETAFSSSSMNAHATPFAPLAPLPPPTTPPPDASNAELVVAVKEVYPDLSKAPTNIRTAVEKAEKLNIKTIGADLQRASDRVTKTGNKLRDLKASQTRHQESWQKHLQEAISCWEGQIESYVNQQNAYKEMMLNARAELQAARKDIQRLNHLAAGPSAAVQPVTVDLTEPDEITIEDTENLVLMERLQSVLHKCTQIMTAPLQTALPDRRAVSVHSVASEDAMADVPERKRQRSLEPGREPAVPGGGGTSSTLFNSDAYAQQCEQVDRAAWVVKPENQYIFELQIFHFARKELGDEFKEGFHALHNASALRSQILDDVQDTPSLKAQSQCGALRKPTSMKRTASHWDPLLRPGRRRPEDVSFCEQVQVHVWDPSSKSTALFSAFTSNISNILDDDRYLSARLEPHLSEVLSHEQKHCDQTNFITELSRVDDSQFDQQYNQALSSTGEDDQAPNFVDLTFPRGTSPFLHHLQDLLRHLGLRVQEEQPLRLRTWYIHHRNVPLWSRPRLVELEGDHELWTHDLHEAWQDQLQGEQPVAYHFVRPSIPDWTAIAITNVLADVILTQGTEDWRSGLIALFPDGERAASLTAASMPAEVSGRDVLNSIDALFLLDEGNCHIFHGWTNIHLDEDRHHVEHGHSFVIHAFRDIAIDIETDEITFMATSHNIPFPAEVPAVLNDNTTDDASFMATFHNAPHANEAPVFEQPAAVQQDDAAEAELSDHESSTDDYESDFTINTPDEELPWHSVAVFDTQAHSIRGRVPFSPYEAFFRRVRALLGLRHHDVSRILQIKPTPDDLLHVAVTPLLLLRHDDFEDGDFRRAALVDVEHHGSSWSTQVETDRFIIKLPDYIHRSNFLAWIRVDKYCTSQKDQCIVWHKGQPVPLRSTGLMHIDHGDYIRVAVPPFQHAEVPTQFAAQCTQAGLTPRQTLERYRLRGDDTDSLYSAITAGQPHDDHATFLQFHLSDQISLMQLPSRESSADDCSPTAAGSSSDRPAWHAAMLEAFTQQACVEHDDEGPAGYIETWLLQGDRPYVTDSARTYRATQASRWWHEELLHLWEDKIVKSKRVHLFWVTPKPKDDIFKQRLGHLLLVQDLTVNTVPAVLTIDFEADTSSRFALAAALLPNPVTKAEICALARLTRFYSSRRSTLSHGPLLWSSTTSHWIPPGAGLSLQFHPPMQAHFGEQHQVDPQIALHHQEQVLVDDIPFQPPLAEQSHFTRQLHEIWDRTATFGPAHLERLLRIETWYLDGRYVRIHDEHRNIVLADDFWMWESIIAHRWRDFVVADAEIDYVLVTPTPSLSYAPNEVHIIVHQRVAEFEHPSIVTVVDNGVLQGEPYSTAVILPSAVTKPAILRSIGKERYCPPFVLDTSCHCWHRDINIDIYPFANRRGYSFDVHIHRNLPQNFWSDAVDEATDSSISLLQIGSTLQNGRSGERLIVGQVAHTQQPPLTAENFQKIDLHPAIKAFEQFDSHFLLPDLDLPCVHPGHPAYEWIANWWDFATPGHTVWLYYDGSAKLMDDGKSVTAAVAAFIAIEHVWYFAGAVSAPRPFASNSYEAEHFASAASLKLAYDLCKIHEGLQAPCPELHFCFDALTVGHQTAGVWHCFQHPQLGAALRNIHRLIESRFCPIIYHWHVRGHCGHPGNELVDHLANTAHGQIANSTSRWLEALPSADFCQTSAWFWVLFDQQFAPHWWQHQLWFAQPTTTPEGELLGLRSETQSDATPPTKIEVKLRFATCNVLSLCGARDDVTCGISGPSRQDMLLEQLRDEGIVIFGIQETRLRRLHHAHSEHYFLFKAPANERGQLGLMAGFARHMPYASRITSDGKSTPIKFREQDFSIIHYEPRILIIRISGAALKCICIVCHAPHTGTDSEVLEQWWFRLRTLIPVNYNTWPRLLLTDANATVGHTTDESIGDHQAGPLDEKSAFFEAFVRESGLWLPSTFANVQQGAGDTWTHSGGNTRRIDYVGLPHCWSPRACSAWVSQIIDPSITRTDHHAACAELSFAGELYSERPLRSPSLTFDNAKSLDMTCLQAAADIGFHIDVHTHAARLQSCLIDALHPQSQQRVKKPRKQAMSAETWTLVQQKRQARQALADLNERQRLDQLLLLFQAWRSPSSTPTEFVAEYNRLFRMQNMLIAKALATFRDFGRQVTRALRYDDIQFFQTLLAEGADFLSPHDVRQFWTIIRRSLPKFRQRKMQFAPARIEALEHQMLPHLCDLELGERTTSSDLLQQCHQRQHQVMDLLSSDALPLHQLPSLTQFETSLRATTSNKATGLDPVPSCVHHDQAPVLAKLYFPLILKMFLWCSEPLQFKGGVMCLIPKKGNPALARNHRGILLLATVAKRAHSMMRSSLMQTLSPKRVEGQLGGFSHQLVQFGFHAVNTWTYTMHKRGMSTAVLYLDLSNAFHHLLRELVLGVARESDFASVLHDLRTAGHPVEACAHGQRLVGALQTLGCDARLLQLLRDVHTDTWFTLTSQELIRTKRGTRPGSPLADAVFHVAMTHIMGQVRHWILRQSTFVDLLEAADMPCLTVVWADDVAIPWATERAAMMLPAVRALVHAVDQAFADHGFTVNYDLNKTNCVVSFQGPQAPELRREHLLLDRPGLECVLHDERKIWLHMKPTYKHLAYTYAASHSLEVELRQRVGQAHQAMTTLGKPILRNRHYPVQVRLRLFRVLIETKLFYGLGTWRTPSLRQLRYLRTAFVKMLAQVLRLSGDHRHSNAQILALAGTPDIRVHLAFDRLRYARKVFTVGPEFLQHLVHREFACAGDSWLHGLASDLLWLNAVLPGAAPFANPGDFTAVIDFWQDPSTPWQRILKKAKRLHLAQEAMMTEMHIFNAQFFSILRAADAEFDPAPEPLQESERSEVHRCFCGRQFDTPQGLALHRVRVHQQFAPEHHLVNGATCPHCLRFFWTSARLHQHLSYMPRNGDVNRCYQALLACGYNTEYAAVKVSPHLRGAVRLDALQAAGPVTSFAHPRELEMQQIEVELASLADELCVSILPDDPLSEGQQLGDSLSICTRIWIERYRGDHALEADQQAQKALGDHWLQLLLTYEVQFDSWTEMVFLSWGEHLLPDLLAEVLDGELEQIVDQVYYDIQGTLPRAGLLARQSWLHQRLGFLRGEAVAAPQPHRPCRRGTANARERQATIQNICTAFEDQHDWLSSLRRVRWKTLPKERLTPIYTSLEDRPHFLIVHLFSGRRRDGDVHGYLDEWARRRNVTLTVLSMDTANSISYGNLSHRAASWSELWRCYTLGLVTATVAGSPCETFSEARHQQIDTSDLDDGVRRRLPRPLRSFDRILGLAGLSMREVEQLHVGSAFFLQTTLLIVQQLVIGGYFISEHPAPPQDSSRASIWTTPWLQLLREHPDIGFHVVPQWPFGATVPKPTGLLTVRLPHFVRTLFSKADRNLVKPTACAIGVQANGQFRTSQHKEYPKRFCEGLAFSLTSQIDLDRQSRRFGSATTSDDLPQDLVQWVREAREALSAIRETATWLPDFQRCFSMLWADEQFSAPGAISTRLGALSSSS